MQKSFSFGALALLATAFLSSTTREHEVHAGTAVRLDVPAMVDRAELVVVGRIVARRSYAAPHGRIETEYTLHVESTLRGEPRETRTFRLPGGTLENGRGMLIPGLPQFSVGEDTLVFLTRESSTGTRMPVGLAQGKYTVLRDASGHKKLVRALGELSLVDPASGLTRPAPTEGALDYDAVVGEIRTAVSTPRARTPQGGR